MPGRRSRIRSLTWRIGSAAAPRRGSPTSTDASRGARGRRSAARGRAVDVVLGGDRVRPDAVREALDRLGPRSRGSRPGRAMPHGRLALANLCAMEGRFAEARSPAAQAMADLDDLGHGLMRAPGLRGWRGSSSTAGGPRRRGVGVAGGTRGARGDGGARYGSTNAACWATCCSCRGAARRRRRSSRRPRRTATDDDHISQVLWRRWRHARG